MAAAVGYGWRHNISRFSSTITSQSRPCTENAPPSTARGHSYAPFCVPYGRKYPSICVDRSTRTKASRHLTEEVGLWFQFLDKNGLIFVPIWAPGKKIVFFAKWEAISDVYLINKITVNYLHYSTFFQNSATYPTGIKLPAFHRYFALFCGLFWARQAGVAQGLVWTGGDPPTWTVLYLSLLVYGGVSIAREVVVPATNAFLQRDLRSFVIF